MDGHGKKVAVMLDIDSYEELLEAAREAERLRPYGPPKPTGLGQAGPPPEAQSLPA